jgi:hypothetical protein
MDVLDYIEAAGKGRFAQRLAAGGQTLDAPAYIEAALTNLME